MNNLKLRAYDKVGKVMIYGVSPYDDHIGFSDAEVEKAYGGTLKELWAGDKIEHLEGDGYWYYLLDNFELMMWTGLTGLVGEERKDIWEGDIVRNIETGHLLTVGWIPPQFRLLATNQTISYSADVWRYLQLEIIGNIYENPEMLEGNGDK